MRLLHLGPAEVDVAVLQPHVFAGQFLGRRLEWRRQAAVEDLDMLGPNLDRAGVQLGIHGPLRPRRHLAAAPAPHTPTAASGPVQSSPAGFRGKDHLGFAVAVAQVDEQHAAVVAIGIDPAAQGDLPADVS